MRKTPAIVLLVVFTMLCSPTTGEATSCPDPIELERLVLERASVVLVEGPGDAASERERWAPFATIDASPGANDIVFQGQDGEMLILFPEPTVPE